MHRVRLGILPQRPHVPNGQEYEEHGPLLRVRMGRHGNFFHNIHQNFLRNIMGKLCFGFEENCQYVQAEAAGMTALEHTPRDIWAIHSMAHVHEETGMHT